MSHLQDTEFVDLIDGALSAERVAHVDACAACRAHADAMRATLASAGVDEVPEPSPFYWQQFAARVSATIDEQATPRSWFRAPQLAFAALALLVAGLVAFTYWTRTPIADSGIARTFPAADAAPAFIALDDLDTDEAWAVVRAAADDLDEDSAAAAGLAASPSSVGRMVTDLTEEERAELVRLVESELKRTGE